MGNGEIWNPVLLTPASRFSLKPYSMHSAFLSALSLLMYFNCKILPQIAIEFSPILKVGN